MCNLEKMEIANKWTHLKIHIGESETMQPMSLCILLEKTHETSSQAEDLKTIIHPPISSAPTHFKLSREPHKNTVGTDFQCIRRQF